MRIEVRHHRDVVHQVQGEVVRTVAAEIAGSRLRLDERAAAARRTHDREDRREAVRRRQGVLDRRRLVRREVDHPREVFAFVVAEVENRKPRAQLVREDARHEAVGTRADRLALPGRRRRQVAQERKVPRVVRHERIGGRGIEVEIVRMRQFRRDFPPRERERAAGQLDCAAIGRGVSDFQRARAGLHDGGVRTASALQLVDRQRLAVRDIDGQPRALRPAIFVPLHAQTSNARRAIEPARRRAEPLGVQVGFDALCFVQRQDLVEAEHFHDLEATRDAGDARVVHAEARRVHEAVVRAGHERDDLPVAGEARMERRRRLPIVPHPAITQRGVRVRGVGEHVVVPARTPAVGRDARPVIWRAAVVDVLVLDGRRRAVRAEAAAEEGAAVIAALAVRRVRIDCRIPDGDHRADVLQHVRLESGGTDLVEAHRAQ